MKKLKLFLVIFLLPLSSFALTPWGLPTYVDISAYAVNNYSYYRITHGLSDDDLSNLPHSINHKNTFITQLQGKLGKKYPSIFSTVRHNRENSAATKVNFLSDNTDLSEFVFVSGHGSYNTLFFYDDILQATAPTITKTFGGYTRWIIFDNCLTLNASPLYLASWLYGGAHVILGNRSKSGQFSLPSPYNYSSADQFDKFTTRFVTNGGTIWSSYNNAVKETFYTNVGFGIEPAIVFLAGKADNGKSVNFSEEKLQNVYNGPFNYNYGATSLTINWLSQTYGTPAY